MLSWEVRDDSCFFDLSKQNMLFMGREHFAEASLGVRTRHSVLHMLRWRHCPSIIQMKTEGRQRDETLGFGGQRLARDMNLEVIREFKFKKLHEITK